MGTAQEIWLSDRVKRLRDLVKINYSASLYAQRRQVYERVWRESVSVAPVRRSALALAAFLQEKALVVSSDDLLAGGEQYYDYFVPELESSRSADERQDGILTEFRRGYRVGMFCGGLGGHVIAGYARVLEQGWGTLSDAAAARVKTGSGTERDFFEASHIVCQAASAYARRYASRARQIGDEFLTEEGWTRLHRIASACEWIAEKPPRTFFEALQLFWLTHEIITSEQPSGSLSLGRFDQVLYPYYEHDIAAGLLIPEEAAELVQAFWVKLAGWRRGFQNVTLGGSDGKGRDLTNELSYMCLRATRVLRMDQPLISVRWHGTMPRAFWNEIEELLQQGMGFPALFNEVVVTEAKTRLGVSPEDARDWGVVGCVEPSVPGREFSHTEGLRVNWAKVLELMLNGGICTVSGEPFPLEERRDLGCIASFEDFYGWYRKELAYAIDLGIQGMNILDVRFASLSPYPFLSSTMEGCLQAGRDVTAGGTVYNLGTVNGLGMANVADSLVAIKRIVFDQHAASLNEVACAVRADFAGQETLRQALLHYPKYGNDEKEPDRILRELAEDFHREVSRHRNGRGGRMQCGLYTVDSHGFLGKLTGALPCGRRRGVALANGLSPSQGADRRGPTAVICSCAKIDHRQLGNGMVLDLKFAPSFFAEMRMLGIFKPLVETYFRQGGMEIQFNVIDRATLLAAQKSPREYENLLVRVSGFSAYFVDLDQVVQNEIIARTEHVTF